MEAHEMTCEGRSTHCVGQWMRHKCSDFKPITEIKESHCGKCFTQCFVDRPRVPLPIKTISKFKTQGTQCFLIHSEKTIYILCRKVKPTKWLFWFVSPFLCKIKAGIYVNNVENPYEGFCAVLCDP